MDKDGTLHLVVLAHDPRVSEQWQNQGHTLNVSATCCSTLAAVADADWPAARAVVVDANLHAPLAPVLERLARVAPQAEHIVIVEPRRVEQLAAQLDLSCVTLLLGPLTATTLQNCIERLRRCWQAEQRAAELEGLAALGQRIGVLTHEGRNALQLMQANLELLQRCLDGNADAQNYHRRLCTLQERLHRMFDDLRATMAPLALRRQWCDLSELLDQVSQRTALLAGREIRVEQHQNGMPPCCLVDPVRMDQVFRNLLENSLEACSGAVEVQVHWSEVQNQADRALQMRIHDNGSGVAAHERDKIFQPFFTTKSSGTGLGMTIIQHILDAHGGRILLGSDEAPGTEFVLTLPLLGELAPQCEPPATFSETFDNAASSFGTLEPGANGA